MKRRLLIAITAAGLVTKPSFGQDCNNNGIPDDSDIQTGTVLFSDDFTQETIDSGNWPVNTGATTTNSPVLSPPFALHIDSKDVLESASFDLSEASSVLISYFWRSASTDSSNLDVLEVQFWNGVRWQGLSIHAGGENLSDWQDVNLFLPPSAFHSEFKLRFRGHNDDDNDSWYVDDFMISSLLPDCNGNSIPDECDIDNHTSPDGNGNGIPDECEAHTVRYVDKDATNGSQTGEDWENAFVELHSALTAPLPLGSLEIRVAQGTYKPDRTGLTDPREATFQLINNVSIKGGYAGFGEHDPDARDIANFETVLSGDFDDNDDPNDFFMGPTLTENAYHVLVGAGTNGTAVLDGFTITGGFAFELSLFIFRGGGLLNENGSPTIANCTFSRNYAVFGAGINNYLGSYPIIEACTFLENRAVSGGAIHNQAICEPEVINCDFESNKVIHWGGAIRNVNVESSITDCTFVGNSADVELTFFSLPSGGGAITNEESVCNIADCVFDSNESYISGGAIYSQDSALCLTNCDFINNSAEGDPIEKSGLPHNRRGGGGVHHIAGMLTVEKCRFESNISALSGGGILVHSNPATAHLTDCEFISNSASSTMNFRKDGGAVFASGFGYPSPGLEVENCLFVGNNADHIGGGLGVRCIFEPTVTNCTFVGNHASRGGGFGDVGCGIPIYINNCIFWMNSDDDGMLESSQIGYSLNPDNLFISHTCIQNLSMMMGIGNISDNPLFVDPTVPNGDYRLSANSPCLDVGDNVVIEETTDLNGNPRIDSGIVDMGAYEFQRFPGDLDGDTDIDGDDFSVFLLAYGHCLGQHQYDAPSDLDNDGCVTLVDYQLWLLQYRDFIGIPTVPLPIPGDLGDMNGDGVVNGLDIQGFVATVIDPGASDFRSRLVADVNGDGHLNIEDIEPFASCLHSETCP